MKMVELFDRNIAWVAFSTALHLISLLIEATDFEFAVNSCTYIPMLLYGVFWHLLCEKKEIIDLNFALL